MHVSTSGCLCICISSLHIYICIQLPFGLVPPPCLGWLVRWLSRWLVGWRGLALKDWPQIHQVGVQNPPSWDPKSSKIEAKIIIGGVLGPSWPQEAPSYQTNKKDAKRERVRPALPPPSWGPKSIKIGPKSDRKYYHFFNWFEDRFLERFGANLAPSWPPQTFPKWAQVGFNIDASWSVDLRAVFWWMLASVLLIFYYNMIWPK